MQKIYTDWHSCHAAVQRVMQLPVCLALISLHSYVGHLDSQECAKKVKHVGKLHGVILLQIYSISISTLVLELW